MSCLPSPLLAACARAPFPPAVGGASAHAGKVILPFSCPRRTKALRTLCSLSAECLHLVFLIAFAANHDPPIKLYGIPARYANAAYTAASKAGQLEVVQRDLDAFQNVRERKEGGERLSLTFRRFIHSRSVAWGIVK